MVGQEHKAPWQDYGDACPTTGGASARDVTSSKIAARNRMTSPTCARAASVFTSEEELIGMDLVSKARCYFCRGLYHIQSLLSPIVWPVLFLNALVKLQACTWPSTNKVGAMKGVGSFFRSTALIRFPFPPCQ
jgi:hypothetical protein